MLTEKIKELCKAHGISVPKLEDALGFGAGTISKWKTSSPSAEKIKKVAEYFHVSTDYLLNVDNSGYYTNEETAKLAQDVYDNPDLRILFDASRDLRPEDIRFVVDMINRMKRGANNE